MPEANDDLKTLIDETTRLRAATLELTEAEPHPWRRQQLRNALASLDHAMSEYKAAASIGGQADG